MTNKRFVIDGNNFSDFDGFCCEFSLNVLLGKYDWNGNFDALNDVLFGGFGNIEDGEEYTIVWKNHQKSKIDLGYRETVKKLEKRLNNCHSSNVEKINEDIRNARNGNGDTLFDMILDTINNNDNVNLILE